VLVAVGDRDERARLCALLRPLGHRVETAADGAEGLDKAVLAPPEVALLDVGLPLPSGYQLAELLRAVLGETVLLIAYGGLATAEDVRRWRAAGFDAYLVKPAAPAECASWVARRAGAG
jgi:CheY-like chemotaxis protein